MCEGEIHQLHRQHALDVDENEYLRIIERKTASLCAACCRLGALCTGSADGFAEDLARYGVNVGIAFQIADDCLDITGEEDRVGKTLYTDLQKGKLTLPLIRLVSLTPKEKREELRRILFSQNARDAVAALLPALRTHGAIEYAFVRAADHIETAKRHLRRLADSMFKDGLLALADYVLARDR
jgi:octaprenyl-diphosphate synthase